MEDLTTRPSFFGVVLVVLLMLTASVVPPTAAQSTLPATVVTTPDTEAYTVMKYASIIGPLVGCALAVVVIIVQCVPPNSGFVLIVTQASIAAGLNVLAAGTVLHTCCAKTIVPVDEPEIPGILMGFQFCVGCMVGLGGTIAAAFNVEPGTGTAGIVLGAICTVVIVAVFIWFICRVCCCKTTGSNDKSFKITA